MAKFKIPKSVKNTILSIFILLAIMITAGVGYTWYMSRNVDENPSALADPVVVKQDRTVKPTQPAADARVGASVQYLSTPIKPGSNASISIKTNAAATCNISVVYDKIASTDSGLKTKVADEYGTVSWSWTVESSAPVGKWPVKVTCANSKYSGFVQGDLVLSNNPEAITQ